jgi:hypothetical protein
MTVLENFAQLAASHSTNQADRLHLYIKLLEAHIRSQDELLETYSNKNLTKFLSNFHRNNHEKYRHCIG